VKPPKLETERRVLEDLPARGGDLTFYLKREHFSRRSKSPDKRGTWGEHREEEKTLPRPEGGCSPLSQGRARKGSNGKQKKTTGKGESKKGEESLTIGGEKGTAQLPAQKARFFIKEAR